MKSLPGCGVHREAQPWMRAPVAGDTTFPCTTVSEVLNLFLMFRTDVECVRPCFSAQGECSEMPTALCVIL